MSQRALLVQSLLGHLALLQQKYPRKAKSPVAKAMRKCLYARAPRAKAA